MLSQLIKGSMGLKFVLWRGNKANGLIQIFTNKLIDVTETHQKEITSVITQAITTDNYLCLQLSHFQHLCLPLFHYGSISEATSNLSQRFKLCTSNLGSHSLYAQPPISVRYGHLVALYCYSKHSQLKEENSSQKWSCPCVHWHWMVSCTTQQSMSCSKKTIHSLTSTVHASLMFLSI